MTDPEDPRTGGPLASQAMSQSCKYGAPSWSWAALDGWIKWDLRVLLPGERPDIKLIDAIPSGINAMGALTRGRIVVSGKLLPVGVILDNPRESEQGAYHDINRCGKQSQIL